MLFVKHKGVPPTAYFEPHSSTTEIVDDDPVAVSSWLPAFAAFVGAPPPPHISAEAGTAAAGPDAVFYHNNLSGASNAKAKRIFGFEARSLEWIKHWDISGRRAQKVQPR
jgi:hypothetical protein